LVNTSHSDAFYLKSLSKYKEYLYLIPLHNCVCLLLPLFLCSWFLSEEKSNNTERMLVYVKKLAWTLIPGTCRHADSSSLSKKYARECFLQESVSLKLSIWLLDWFWFFLIFQHPAGSVVKSFMGLSQLTE